MGVCAAQSNLHHRLCPLVFSPPSFCRLPRVSYLNRPLALSALPPPSLPSGTVSQLTVRIPSHSYPTSVRTGRTCSACTVAPFPQDLLVRQPRTQSQLEEYGFGNGLTRGGEGASVPRAPSFALGQLLDGDTVGGVHGHHGHHHTFCCV